MQPPPTIEYLGDQAVLIRLGQRIDPALNARAHALAQRLRQWPEAQEVIPAFASVAVTVADPALLDARLLERLQQLLHDCEADQPLQYGRTHTLQVDFGAGEDLPEAATLLGMTEDELIGRLCAPLYQVAMLGFLPGFPYLLGLDPALALPRRVSPRSAVPANTLAIGGAQLGIYPCRSPGGWQLLGRARAELFDPTRSQPALLAPGDLLQLRPA